MTEVLRSPSQLPSSQSSSSTTRNDFPLQIQQTHHSIINLHHPEQDSSFLVVEDEEDDSGTDQELQRKDRTHRNKEGDDPLSLLALFVTAFRKSLVACRTEREELCSMEIGWPTNVRHVAHVTFDRFNGFLGLPAEFEPEVPRRAPSASANVFGVSTESMQLSYDSRGNSVPTILLLMQRHLYAQGGLQVEGIFRINAENSQEEYARDQLNRGIVPNGIDVHCLGGLIKAWFRELPSGLLDSIPSEQMMHCQSEEECAELMRLLPPTESSLLDWAINLMADVVQEEHLNKMNARNVATVFAPNMTQMSDPLTALMYAVKVMNFLKTLITKVLKQREDSLIQSAPVSPMEHSDENDGHSPSLPYLEKDPAQEKEDSDHVFIATEHASDTPPQPTEDDHTNSNGAHSSQSSVENVFLDSNCSCEVPKQADTITDYANSKAKANICKTKTVQSSNPNIRKGPRKVNNNQTVIKVTGPVEKSRGVSIVSRLNSRLERIEAWR